MNWRIHMHALARGPLVLLWRIWPLVGGALVGVGFRLVFSGVKIDKHILWEAMSSSFVLLVPFAVGAVAVYLAALRRRGTWASDIWTGAGANALFVFGTFLVLIEGLICCVLAIPLFAFLGAIGGLLAGRAFRWAKWPRQTVFGFTALPLLLGAVEPYFPTPQEVHWVEYSRQVSATPREIWPVLIDAPDIRPEEIGSAWAYRIGVPLPTSAVTRFEHGTPVRHITMGKNIHFDEIAKEWVPYRRVLWQNRFTPDSFPPEALDDHVRIGGEFFDIMDAEYSMREVTGGTELSARIGYRVSTHFNWYARPIAEFLLSNFEANALAFYAHRAEASRAIAPPYR
jgi:hypothetical protein